MVDEGCNGAVVVVSVAADVGGGKMMMFGVSG